MIDYGAVLADMEARRGSLDQAITALRLFLNGTGAPKPQALLPAKAITKRVMPRGDRPCVGCGRILPNVVLTGKKPTCVPCGGNRCPRCGVMAVHDAREGEVSCLYCGWRAAGSMGQAEAEREMAGDHGARPREAAAARSGPQRAAPLGAERQG